MPAETAATTSTASSSSSATGCRTLSFSLGTRPEGTGIMGARGRRLDDGCAIIVGLTATPDDRGIVVEIWR